MKITMRIIFALTLALCIILSLTACGGGSPSMSVSPSDEPSVSQTTPGATDISPGDTDEPPTTEPDNTSDTPKEPVVLLPDPPSLNEEVKAQHDESISRISQINNIDIDEIIDRIYANYGCYLNENITKNLVRIGVITGSNSDYYSKTNLMGISDIAMQMVNDYLVENGEQPLDIKDHEQNIAAMWIAASLYFDSDSDNGIDYFEIALPFGLARASSSEGDAERRADSVWSLYVQLFNLL